jgi:putative oxidoreductase
MAGLMDLWRRVDEFLSRIPLGFDALLSRIAIAQVFWASGETKVEGFALKPGTIDLFREEYHLPLVPPEVAAPMAAIAEHVFPILLVLGLATRLSALALLGMTAVIQIFVYPESWTVHILWAAILIHLIRVGSGPIGLDAASGLIYHRKVTGH